MTPDADQRARDILGRLAELDAGWATTREIARQLAGDDSEGRQVVLDCLDVLAATGQLRGIVARHRGRPLRLVLLDPERLLSLDDEAVAA